MGRVREQNVTIKQRVAASCTKTENTSNVTGLLNANYVIIVSLSFFGRASNFYLLSDKQLNAYFKNSKEF